MVTIRQLGIIVGVAVLAAGCQAPLRQTYQFPAMWPGTQPLGEDAPTVSVQPIRLTLTEGDPRAIEPDGLPTDAVLSALFIKHLHVNGVNAVLEPTEAATGQYTLGCTIPHLWYGIREGGYPKEYLYKAELGCTLRDELTQTVVWTRNLQQYYEKTVLLDMMTRLPTQPHQHNRILYRECIVPLWDAMASTVGMVLVSRRQLAGSGGGNAVEPALDAAQDVH